MGNPNEVNDPSSTNPPSSPMLDRSTTYSFNEGEYLIFYDFSKFHRVCHNQGNNASNLPKHKLK